MEVSRMNAEKQISDVMEEHGITCEITFADTNPNMETDDCRAPMNHWLAVFSTGDGTWSVPYSTGLGITDEPTGADVLECLVMDAESVDAGQSFEEWAEGLGYDSDSRKAEATYRTIVNQTRRLKLFVGHDAFEAIAAAAAE